MLDGVPVFSFRAEDLPQYKQPDRHYNLFDRTIRGRALAKKIFASHPTYSGIHFRKISELASSHSFAAMRVLLKTTAKGSEAALFILKRPNVKEASLQSASKLLGMRPSSVTPHIPEAITRFVAVHHEIGHMLQIINDENHPNNFTGDYYSELSAESNGLSEFQKASQHKPYSPHYLKNLIERRALASFTAASPEYWLAPALSKMFLENDYLFLDQHNPHDVYRSYAEIRLRVAILSENQSAAQVAAQWGLSQKKLTRVWKAKNNIALSASSHYLQQAITLWVTGNVSRVYGLPEEASGSNFYLAHFIPQLDTIRHSIVYQEQLNNGALFQLLEQVHQQGNLSEVTRKNITQILDSTHIFCPEIAPQRQNAENKTKLTCPEPKN
ncbi:MAG: hypothetical protein A3B66_00410 [Alphaproteobacteria bacterium RIFCSPHIGHO2_02_FULL_46_13]|nr:MAG: hypothetical protein A3B66_00410 [Alphaproteobacteria bacterium RIFCSPHIGHO2_02_FULL_46_13]